MRFDFSALSTFQEYLDNRLTAEEVLQHPAYGAVNAHASLLGDGLSPQDLELARKGLSSRFYGLAHYAERVQKIEQLAQYLRRVAPEWVNDTADSLSLFSGQSLEGITVYPIIGYDLGIGINNTICMNLNQSKYLSDPEEFLYYMIHESFHVISQWYNPLPKVSRLGAHSDWIRFLHWAFRDEGYATYAPWEIRRRRGHLKDQDYVTLHDEDLLTKAISDFTLDVKQLTAEPDMSPEKRIDIIYGPSRACYRVGCELVRRIRNTYGISAVKEGAFMDSSDYWQRYAPLLGL